MTHWVSYIHTVFQEITKHKLAFKGMKCTTMYMILSRFSDLNVYLVGLYNLVLSMLCMSLVITKSFYADFCYHNSVIQIYS